MSDKTPPTDQPPPAGAGTRDSLDTPERWRHAAEIATRALQLPADEVNAFLDQQCALHSRADELRHEVESLLAAPSLCKPSTELRDRPNKTSHAIDNIGPYRIVRSLGRGGMGEVFLARQTAPIERDVAIKLIQTAQRRHLAHRFELERRTLARMSHPYIAQVYEAGDTEDGLPFLVMELIDGQPIDGYCDQKQLSLARRLRLFGAVCAGIHHAHQKGILHRDLKPANILITEVEGEPTPKIIDFGIAKALDEDAGVDVRQLTRAGGFVGTPAYLSPESVVSPGSDDDVDIRTDVYALGVLLFRLLVGELPFKDDTLSWLELLRTISEEDAPPPTTRFANLDRTRQKQLAERRRLASPEAMARSLRGDLDAIVLMAVARERDARYGSAAELAADVERFLTDQPVVARPRSRWYETRKYVRRHRAAVIAATFVMFSLIAGIVARTIEARRADRAAVNALQAQQETEHVVEFLVGLFEVSDPGRSLGDSITARELLDEGAARLRRELDDQPLSRARLLDTVGVVYERLGLYPKAAEVLTEGLAERQKHATGEDHLPVAESLVHLGLARWNLGELDEARRLYERALEIRTRALGPTHHLVAEVLDDLGMVYELEADFEQAEQLLRRALAIREAHFGPASKQVAETLNHLAIASQDQGRFDDAELLMTRVLEIREANLGSIHPEVARALNGVAIAISAQGRHADAELLLRRALEIRETVLGAGHTEVGQVLNNLASVVLAQERPDEAIVLMERGLELWESALGAEHARTGIAVYNLGDFYLERGEIERAEPFLRRAHDIFTAARGPDHPHVAFAAKRLADLLRDSERLAESEALYRRAYMIRRAKMPADHPQLGSTARQLAELLRLRDKHDEAAALEELYPEPDDEP